MAKQSDGQPLFYRHYAEYIAECLGFRPILVQVQFPWTAKILGPGNLQGYRVGFMG
jgi:hypothetical protein